MSAPDSSAVHTTQNRADASIRSWVQRLPGGLRPGPALGYDLMRAYLGIGLFVRGHPNQFRGIEPPDTAGVEPDLRFRPQLIAITSQGFHVDPATGDGPEPARAGLVPKVRAVVDAAGKDALSRRLDQSHAVRRSEAIGGPTHERLDPCHLRVAQAVQLRQLDDPNAAGLHGSVFAAQICQFIREVLASNGPQRGRLSNALWPFEDEAAIGLSPGVENPSDGRDEPALP